mmetsp:Transcript_20963/g.23333  ORF Transcript_20963/g.23333 Transcript_20963/m.23333 type:complete len:121 (-) Transcript_20963:111-473(-)|eukprot:CAMPEP_0205832094 /NCGR_PEP_ID=MMETSP0206-20130828/46013_1 /ASSEMBLY_ACC=CAM_ASM_000279 /TAXON_ID=36767 /ORGANISM="Euplotes focardii, Strain TN1" /LENGTH=120 /DNA_ID=CAMNT_0053137323 /DNA_START=53 /DNA_END=415 /DNA_ORIENTATION=-
MNKLLFAVVVLAMCAVSVTAQNVYYFNQLSSPEFPAASNKLEEPTRSTRTVIFSIDTPLFRDEFFDSVTGLSSFNSDDSVSPIGWAGPIPDFQTEDVNDSSASSVVVSAVAVVAALVVLL